MPHEAATESLFLVTCYCCCCRCSEELHLGCLPSWLIGIYLGSLPQQLENPCLQGSPKDTILYDYWCEPPVNDGSSSHCDHEWGPSYKSCSDHVKQLVWQHSVGFFVLLPALYVCLVSLNTIIPNLKSLCYYTEFFYTRLGLTAKNKQMNKDFLRNLRSACAFN